MKKPHTRPLIGTSFRVIACRLSVVATLLMSTGCAIHYFDGETGTEHIWGIGHMAMKPGAASEGLEATAHRTDVVGVSLGKLQEDLHVEIGWGARQRIDIFDANTRLCMAWPRGSFYNARIGSEFPLRLHEGSRDMAGTTEFKDVPRERVGNQVQQAIFAGATKIECEKQPDPDDRWTVRAR